MARPDPRTVHTPRLRRPVPRVTRCSCAQGLAARVSAEGRDAPSMTALAAISTPAGMRTSRSEVLLPSPVRAGAAGILNRPEPTIAATPSSNPPCTSATALHGGPSPSPLLGRGQACPPPGRARPLGATALDADHPAPRARPPFSGSFKPVREPVSGSFPAELRKAKKRAARGAAPGEGGGSSLIASTDRWLLRRSMLRIVQPRREAVLSPVLRGVHAGPPAARGGAGSFAPSRGRTGSRMR